MMIIIIIIIIIIQEKHKTNQLRYQLRLFGLRK